MLCEAFNAVLKAGRSEFNTQFALARRAHPALKGEDFSEFVRTSMDPLARAVSAVNPDAVFQVISAAWPAGLELTGQRLAGPEARQRWIDQTWQQLLVAAAPLVAQAPQRIIGAMSNAAHHLGTTPGARPAQWLELMQRIAALSTDVEIFLKAGQVAAWRSGMAHYRSGALQAAAETPAPLAAAALEANGANWPELLERLNADPWHMPGAVPDNTREVKRAGAFRGFGGLFTQPPVAIEAQDQIFVRSGDEHWMLAADAFGATFHRAMPQELEAAAALQTRLPAGMVLPMDIGSLTSVARTRKTVALTGSLTHAVLLFAAPPSP